MDDEKIRLSFQVDTRGLEVAEAKTQSLKRSTKDLADAQEREAARAARAAEREAQRAAAAQEREAAKAAKAQEREAAKAAAAAEREAAKAAAAQEREAKKAADAIEREAKRTQAAKDRAAAEIAAIEDRWLQREIRDRVNWEARKTRAIDGTTTAFKGSGAAALQASYALQDLAQGGIGAVINNIPGIIASLGGGPGLAGILGGVGVAAILAKPAIEGLIASFKGGPVDQFKGRVEALEEVVKGIEKKEVKLFVDDLAIRESRKEVERLKADFNALQAAMGRQTLEERESGAAVERATTGPEARAALAGATEARREELVKNSGALLQNRGQQAAAAAKIARLEEDKASGQNTDEQLKSILADLDREEKRLATLRDDERKIRDALATEAKQDVGGVLNRAIGGVGATQTEAQARLRQELARQGPAGALIAKRLMQATPEAVAEQQAADEEIEEDQRENERRLRKRKTADRQAAREAARDEAKAQKEGIKDLGELAGETTRDLLAEARGLTPEQKEQRRGDERLRKRRGAEAGKQLGRNAKFVEGRLGEAALQELMMMRVQGVSDEAARENLTSQIEARMKAAGVDRDPMHRRAVAAEAAQNIQERFQGKFGGSEGLENEKNTKALEKMTDALDRLLNDGAPIKLK